MPKETGKGYSSGNLCGFKLQSTEAIRWIFYDAFNNFMMFYMVWFFMGEENKKVKVKRKGEEEDQSSRWTLKKDKLENLLTIQSDDTKWPRQRRDVMGPVWLSSEECWSKCYVLLQSWLMSDDENFYPARGEVVNLVDWNAYIQYVLNLEKNRCSKCYYSSIIHHNYRQ
jgi:hypothetical protein